jgi:hypothetical protein
MDSLCQFHTGMLQNLQMRPIPELMDDYNKTLTEFKVPALKPCFKRKP